MVELIFTTSAHGIPPHLRPPPNSHLWFLLPEWNLNALTFLVFPDSLFSSTRFKFSYWNLHKPVTPASLQLSPVITRAWHHLYVFCLISLMSPRFMANQHKMTCMFRSSWFISFNTPPPSAVVLLESSRQSYNSTSQILQMNPELDFPKQSRNQQAWTLQDRRAGSRKL